MERTWDLGHKGRGDVKAQQQRRKERLLAEGPYQCILCNITLKHKGLKYGHEKSNQHQQKQHTLNMIEKKFLSQIDYKSTTPYEIKTYVNTSWTNKYEPILAPRNPQNIYIEISNDYSSILFYYQTNIQQYFLQDGYYYTKEEYEHI
jgi:hypothetical protein